MIRMTLFHYLEYLNWLKLDILYQKILFQVFGQKLLFQEFPVVVTCVSLSTHGYRKFNCCAQKSKQLTK